MLSLISAHAYADDGVRTISGTVQDVKGNPLVGAVVMHPESNSGAITDADGSFSIKVPGGGSRIRNFYFGLYNQNIQYS